MSRELYLVCAVSCERSMGFSRGFTPPPKGGGVILGYFTCAVLFGRLGGNSFPLFEVVRTV